MINSPHGNTPKWFLVLIILLMLPLFQMPYLISLCQPGATVRMFLWFYPAYALLSGYLAYICYPGRRTIAWILLILLILSHLSIWALVTTPIEQ